MKLVLSVIRQEAMMMRRIGVYGGTFDPVHLAHLVLAEQCLEELRLDQVWFVPSAVSPHKQGQSITSGAHRLAMLQLALAGHEQFRIDPVELNRSGISYTVDTLTALEQRSRATQWFLLMGADSLYDFPNWREPEEICRLATLAVVNRDSDRPLDFQSVPPTIRDHVTQVRIPDLQISSSDIRRRVRERKSIRFLVPRPVEIYIREHHLYGSPSADVSVDAPTSGI